MSSSAKNDLVAKKQGDETLSDKSETDLNPAHVAERQADLRADRIPEVTAKKAEQLGQSGFSSGLRIKAEPLGAAKDSVSSGLSVSVKTAGAKTGEEETSTTSATTSAVASAPSAGTQAETKSAPYQAKGLNLRSVSPSSDVFCWCFGCRWVCCCVTS